MLDVGIFNLTDDGVAMEHRDVAGCASALEHVRDGSGSPLLPPSARECYSREVASSDLAFNLDSALRKIGAFFVSESPIQRAARAVARRLDELGIDYAIAGALCLGAHGVVRATEDVDVLLGPDDLERFKAAWIGRGYVNLRPGGKAVRDTEQSVKIDFLLTGDYPGDGKPKPIRFPEAKQVATPAGDLRVIALPRFIELKLASGMTAPHRLQDLADVLRLIETSKLPREFSDTLDPYVRAKYDELWHSAQHPDDDY